MTASKTRVGEKYPVQLLLDDWLGAPDDDVKCTPKRVCELLRFLVALDLVPAKALLTELTLSKGQCYPLLHIVRLVEYSIHIV